MNIYYVDKHKIAVRVLNSVKEGIPTFLIHGITSSLALWEVNGGRDPARPFLNNGPCYAISLPGHYPAKFPANFKPHELTAKLIATILAAVIKQISPDKPVMLVGHSTGGFAALAITIYYPEIVQSVVSISGFSSGKWTGTLGLQQSILNLGGLGKILFKASYELSRLNPRIYGKSWLVHVPKKLNIVRTHSFRSLSDICYPNFEYLDLDSMICYFSNFPKIDITKNLTEISVPVLAITGEKDPTVPFDQSRIIAQKIHKGQLSIIKNVGHLAFFEAPEEYYSKVHNWLLENR